MNVVALTEGILRLLYVMMHTQPPFSTIVHAGRLLSGSSDQNKRPNTIESPENSPLLDHQ